jgi:elongation factor P
MKANDIRKGQALRIDGKLFVVTDVQHRTPGNLRAFVQVKIKDVKAGNVLDRRFSSTEEVEGVNLDRRDVEYLYKDSTGAVFMDNESYEQFTIPDDVLGEALLFIKPNETIKGLFHDTTCLSVELPSAVELVIADTEPGIKNATATNVGKDATCETGLKIKVPPFINVGEKVRINTETLAYLGRVND